MRRTMRCAALLLCLCLVLGTGAAALPAPPEITAPSAVLFSSDGTMLYQKNAHEPLQPASVTKIMTMLLIMEAIDEGRLAWDEMVTASAYAASMGGTQIFLQEGEQMTVEDMFKSIVVASANDAAVAMAEHLGGSEEGFVQMMNERAAELGMEDSHFINANGLDGDGEKTLTSAYDLALASCELLKHETVKNYTSIWMDTVRNGQFGLANTNKMLKRYEGMTGLKTGYISQAVTASPPRPSGTGWSWWRSSWRRIPRKTAWRTPRRCSTTALPIIRRSRRRWKGRSRRYPCAWDRATASRACWAVTGRCCWRRIRWAPFSSASRWRRSCAPRWSRGRPSAG